MADSGTTLTPEAQALKDEIIDHTLDWAYMAMFRFLREETVFDADRVEQQLWGRIAARKPTPPAQPAHSGQPGAAAGAEEA